MASLWIPWLSISSIKKLTFLEVFIAWDHQYTFGHQEFATADRLSWNSTWAILLWSEYPGYLCSRWVSFHTAQNNKLPLPCRHDHQIRQTNSSHQSTLRYGHPPKRDWMSEQLMTNLPCWVANLAFLRWRTSWSHRGPLPVRPPSGVLFCKQELLPSYNKIIDNNIYG